MKIKQKQINNISLLVIAVIFIAVSTRLDLFKENYSTLSLSTKGYFLFLFMGLLAGIVLAYNTYLISGKKYALLMFIALLLGTIIPHDITYNLQGNLHLLNAYLGFVLMEVVMFINVYKYSFINYKKSKTISYILIISLIIAFLSYTRYMCVNTLSELIVMLTNLFVVYLINK